MLGSIFLGFYYITKEQKEFCQSWHQHHLAQVKFREEFGI